MPVRASYDRSLRRSAGISCALQHRSRRQRPSRGRPDRIAMIGVGESGDVWRMSFRDVQRRANRLANLLVGLGLTRGERVLQLLGQDPWTAIGHVACWKAALCRCRPRRCSHPTPSPTGSTRRRARGHYRPCQPVHRDQARKAAPVVEHVFLIDGEGPGARSLSAALDTARDSFVNVIRRRTIPPSSTSPPAPPAIRKARLQAHRRCSFTSRYRARLRFFSAAGRSDVVAGGLGVGWRG